MVDRLCLFDPRRTALVLEIRYNALPKQPSLGYDRLFAILARGGL